VVAIARSPDRRTMVERVNQDSSLASLAALVQTQAKAQPDLIIAEGFKTSPVPKILVIDDGEMTESVTNIIATVGRDGTDQRVLNYSFNDLDNSAEWLSKVLLKSRQLP
jgi:molybdopterin-guanine dinucleotide biosynthesis protein